MRHVVIIGGGFAGLSAARALKDAPVYVTLIDRSNHHLFQPLLYQVAMAGLSAPEIATPIRSVLRNQKNARVLLGDVVGVDLARKRVELRSGERLAYDFVVVAAGARTNFFGKDEWAKYALGLKDLDDALEIRERVLLAFEAAEREPDEHRRERLLSFVVVGGGPTGVELAGALAELSRFVLARDFRHIQPGATRITLVEGGPRVLGQFDPESSSAAEKQLADLGVEVRTGERVENIDAEGVHLAGELLPAATVLWGAGVRAASLAELLGVPTDRAGRIVVEEDCSVSGRPEVFAVGDIACFTGPDGKPLPGLAPVAIQQGKAVGENIARTVLGQERIPFRYVHKGAMATIGRSRAVAERGRMRSSGFIAWIMWLAVHVLYLVGFRNRLVVVFDWVLSYLTYGRGARIITGRQLRPGTDDLQKVVHDRVVMGAPPSDIMATEVFPVPLHVLAALRSDDKASRDFARAPRPGKNLAVG